MDVWYMTLDGRAERDAFIAQWWDSSDHMATFLQTNGAVYLMPYGHYERIPREQEATRFAGPYRRHSFVKRDFGITDPVLGGGYAILSGDRRSCKAGGSSDDFGPAKDADAVALSVKEALLQ